MPTYLRLEVVRMFRDRRFTFFTLAVPVAFYLLWASVFKGNGTEPKTGLDIQTYLMVSMASFGAIGASLSTTGQRFAAERASGWLRQLQTTPLRPWAVVTGRTVASMVLALPAILLVSLVAVAVEGVRVDPLHWVLMVVLMWIASLPFAALGILIGCLAGPDSAQPITLGAYFALSILGGLWMPVSQLPSALRTIAVWTPSNRFGNLGWTLVSGHAPTATTALVLVAWTAGLGALAIPAYRRTLRAR
ncbi:ABC transporter permease [Actinomadura harenae]|uniref:Transport permease protein n=1 Tax=Actinomadura harenae TaxID=2483351 RepID=A0A3M2MDY6_9ACTN|nr:ABC transporter permease [Actinomadura harenae]RMI47741.1 ABC transporter permease [Actinomadura harenae]